MKTKYIETFEKRAGSTILATAIFLFIGFGIASVTIRDAIHNSRMVNEQVSMEKAHYFAEAGVEEAADYITSHTGYFPNTYEKGKSYSNGGRWDYLVTKTDWREYSIESVGSYDGNSRTISIQRAYYPTFAAFSIWSHDFRDLWYTPGYVLQGHVHSDSRINIWSSPTAGGPHFQGKVTTGHHEFGGYPEFATFDEGYEFDSYQGTLQSIEFTEMKSEANANGEVFYGRTEVYFDVNPANNEGRVWVKNRRRWPNQPNTWHQMPTDGLPIIYVADSTSGPSSSRAGKLTMHGGVLKGEMSIFTDNDVVIQNHMQYYNDPSDDQDFIRDFPEESEDRLGVISKDDIWIGTSAPNSLQLFGAYLASGSKANHTGEMGVLNYNDYSRGFRGYINQYGSKVVERVYPAGVFNSNTGTPLAGYRTNTTFDERFRKRPPPYYPALSEKLIFEDWAYGTVLENSGS